MLHNRKKIVLKPEVMEEVNDSQVLIALLVQETGKSYESIRRYIRNNDTALCHIQMLNVISKHLQIPIDDLTQEVAITEEAA